MKDKLGNRSGVDPYSVTIVLDETGRMTFESTNGGLENIDSVTIRCGLSGWQLLDLSRVPASKRKVLDVLGNTDEITEPVSQQPEWRGGDHSYL